MTAAQVTNTGNTALNIDWDLVAVTASGANPWGVVGCGHVGQPGTGCG